MKLPAIQFYPGDWHKDQGVQALDLMQRGAWFELLLMMHDSDERGVLLVNGQPMPDAVIARRLGLDNQTANQILTTLLSYGVASRRTTDGALFCRRMVKDEKLRQVRTEAGRKGGNPNLLNQKVKQTPTTGVKQIPTPSTSFTTSIKERGAANAAPAPKSEKSGSRLPSTEKNLSVSPSPQERGPGGEVPRPPRKPAPTPPTLAEVQAYAAAQYPGQPAAQAEAAAFHDHYQSNGWRVSGKTPMQDWRAAFRQWMRRCGQFQAAGPAGGTPPPARARTAPKPADPNRWS